VVNAPPIGVVLAGGKSSRMGRDKALCDIKGIRLVDRAIARLRPQVNRILISGPQDYGSGLECVPDAADGPDGPCAGIFAVGRRLANEAQGFLTVPVDAPFLPLDLAKQLVGARSAVASAGGVLHPTFAWWNIADLERAARFLQGARGLSLRKLAETAGARVVPWADEAPFRNINTVDDLKAACTDARPAAQERG
jgi:molybdenum cofactor guanylyltransferase